ncbi:MAG: adenine phosphoribosyltransferase [Sedimentisphaerales bacterium]|nr:adenine phosphoribosyltransferase [Sedimentisphaerales bacterium]
MDLKDIIRKVPDFPKKGIMFIDITTLLADAAGLAAAVEAMSEPFLDKKVELVVGAESRGFIFGTAIARQLNCGFVPVRKPGKLPARTLSQEYSLEYGTDTLEIHADAIRPGQNVLIVDDLLATGGTMQACCKMVEILGGNIVGISLLIELTFLNGRDKLSEYNIHSVVTYDSE